MPFRTFIIFGVVFFNFVCAALADTRICNTGNVEIYVAQVLQADGLDDARGWHPLAPGKCIMESYGYWAAIGQKDRKGRFGIADYPIGFQAPIFYSSNRYFCVRSDTFHYRGSYQTCPDGFKKILFGIEAAKRDDLLPYTLNIRSNADADIAPLEGEKKNDNTQIRPSSAEKRQEHPKSEPEKIDASDPRNFVLGPTYYPTLFVGSRRRGLRCNSIEHRAFLRHRYLAQKAYLAVIGVNFVDYLWDFSGIHFREQKCDRLVGSRFY